MRFALRTPGSWSDRSQKKADIRVSGLDTHSVNDTLIDFGITHSTIGTNLTNKSMGETFAVSGRAHGLIPARSRVSLTVVSPTVA